MNLLVLHKLVAWTIFACVMFFWLEILVEGPTNISFDQSLTVATFLLILLIFQSFLKWRIRLLKQLENNKRYERIMVHELDDLKEEGHWKGNENLENALKQIKNKLDNRRPSP